MKQDHAQFTSSQFKELPSPLPVGERVLWQGKPSFKGLAWRSFHIREVSIYFAALLAWRVGSSWFGGASAVDVTAAALWLIVPAACAIGVLVGLAWAFRRATCYTITNQRVLFQFGVALPMTMNIPLGKIANAALKTYRDGSGDIPLQLDDGHRASYLLLWPHIRPWRFRTPEPMLNAIPDAAAVAAIMAQALQERLGPSASASSQPVAAGRTPGAVPYSSATAAA